MLTFSMHELKFLAQRENNLTELNHTLNVAVTVFAACEYDNFNIGDLAQLLYIVHTLKITGWGRNTA